MASVFKTISIAFRRRLVIDDAQESNLRRCLTRLDLINLGLSSTLGVGVYVLVGAVALKISGPSIVLSFLIASVAAMFAGLCFAEFGARVPRAGSAYVYTYVTIGEFVAFFIGWNVLLEGLFGTASVAKGLSMYVDSMLDGKMSAWLLSVLPLPSNLFSSYFDLFAFGAVVLLGVLLAVGARQSALVNNFFSFLNLAVIAFVIVAGLFTVNPKNWSIPASEVPEGYGSGGFFPYGAWGTLQGATLCFYGFTGFDAINSTGEEVKDPRRIIPQAIVIVLCVVFLVYASISTVITMMVPYYLLDKVTATALAFKYVGWDWARWLVIVGAVTGIFASLFGSLFPVTRLLYAMASDGLILHWFACVSNLTNTPLFATTVSTITISLLAATLELEELILMMAVGTLFSYTIVATCVVLLRYRSGNPIKDHQSYFKQTLGFGDREASKMTSRIVNMSLFLYVTVCLLSAILAFHVVSFNTTIFVVVFNAVALLLLIIMTLQPKAIEEIKFKTPLVPVVPCLSIYINVHMMVFVNIRTWIRVLIWIAIGFPIYFMSIWCYKSKAYNGNEVMDDDKINRHKSQNGTGPVKIVIESPTPPSTLNRNSKIGDENLDENKKQINEDIIVKQSITSFQTDEIIVQQAIIENNEEKEAKIIDLLDQVLQAEEDSYCEKESLQEDITEEDIMTPLENTDSIPHRKSLSELSDAGSETSFSNQDTKYSVIAQVHREDLPKVSEEEEKVDNETVNDATNDNVHDNEYEQVTSFNDSDTNSRTDESGYSDTIDRSALNDSVEDTREEGSRIPTPPPMDEKYFNSPYLLKKSFTIAARVSRQKSVEENDDEERKPRESVQSNNSHGTDDGNITFGSTRQMRFMNKLNDIFQNKMASDNDNTGDEQRKRSNSTGDVRESAEVDELTPQIMRDRPSLFFNLKKELAAMSVPNLRPVRNEDTERLNKTEPITANDDDETIEDSSLSREDLKSKLETIFAVGGPKLVKPRLMKSNPPTPEEVNQTDTSSSESMRKLPKIEKNDTLKRQKDKFSNVLNSFRLSLNKDDAV